MKVTNLLGNVFQGTIGKSVTASTWKGRNYLKKWFKPTNPNSAQQQVVRGWMSAIVALWQEWTSLQKRAYYWYQRYRKLNISGFNAAVGDYIATYKATGDPPTAPSAAGPHFRNSQTQDDLEGVKCLIRRTGQATDYYLEYSDDSGKCGSSLVPSDENFDLYATLTGYEPYTILDSTADECTTTHDMDPL